MLRLRCVSDWLGDFDPRQNPLMKDTLHRFHGRQALDTLPPASGDGSPAKWEGNCL